MIKVYKTIAGAVIFANNKFYACTMLWDDLINRDSLHAFLTNEIKSLPLVEQPRANEIQAPVGSQEVWASGVTYFRSKEARMDESKK